jgi:hypothetical protein
MACLPRSHNSRYLACANRTTREPLRTGANDLDRRDLGLVAELHRPAVALPDRWQPMVYVAGACELRFSEVAGLRVARVDLARYRLHVIETAPQVGGNRAEPKTAAGRRTVPVPGLIAEILDAHVSRYGHAGETDGLVFSAPRRGRLHAANWHKRAWLPARRAAGYPHAPIPRPPPPRPATPRAAWSTAPSEPTSAAPRSHRPPCQVGRPRAGARRCDVGDHRRVDPDRHRGTTRDDGHSRASLSLGRARRLLVPRARRRATRVINGRALERARPRRHVAPDATRPNTPTLH